MNKYILVLGAGKSQISLLYELKHKGYSIIGIDRNPNAAGFSYCDIKLVASTHNPNLIIELIYRNKLNKQLLGVITRSNGRPTITQATIIKEFNLAGPSIETAKIAISKSKTIEFLSKKGIPTPKQYLLEDVLSNKIEAYPLILKPDITVEGKKGIKLINNLDSFKVELPSTRLSGENEQIEIEEFVRGKDLLAVALCYEDITMPWFLLEEYNKIDQTGDVKGLGFGYPAQGINEKAIWKVVEETRKALDLVNGTLICNLRYKNHKEIKLIEIHLDLGGDMVMDVLIPSMGCIHPFEFMIKPFLGLPPTIPTFPNANAAVLFIQSQNETKDESFDKIRMMPAVRKVAFKQTSSQRKGYISLFSKDRKSFEEALSISLNTIT